MTNTAEDKFHGAKENAKGWLASIEEMLDPLHDEDIEEASGERERAIQTIHESVLSVLVRDGWRQPGSSSEGAEEYEILLSTGGPALTIGAIGMIRRLLAALPLALAIGGAAYADSITINGISVPDPRQLHNGTTITTSSAWESTRRTELLNDFKETWFGQPLPGPGDSGFSQSNTPMTTDTNDPVRRKDVAIAITGPNGTKTMTLRMFIPLNQASKPAVFLQIDHRNTCSDDPTQYTDYTPVSQINARGYAFACFRVSDVAPDDASTYRSKMINLFKSGSLANDDAKALGAWSWAASRAMDYLATDSDIDTNRVYVLGFSRSAKSALWAAALDTRFAAVFVDEAGIGGSRLIRHTNSNAATIQNMKDEFRHWFPETFYAYAGNDTRIPIDANELTSLVANRVLYVSSATNDDNEDPPGELLGFVGAQRIYSLYETINVGLSDTSWQPTADHEYHSDNKFGYHLRTGNHDLALSDWTMYMDYADQHLPSTNNPTFQLSVVGVPANKSYALQALNIPSNTRNFGRGLGPGVSLSWMLASRGVRAAYTPARKFQSQGTGIKRPEK